MHIITKDKVAVITNKNTFTVYENGEESGSVKLGEEALSFDISDDATTAYVGSNVSTDYQFLSLTYLERNFLQDQPC